MRKRGWEWQKETIIGDEHALYGCEFVSCCLLKLKSWQQSLIKGMRILFSDIVQVTDGPQRVSRGDDGGGLPFSD